MSRFRRKLHPEYLHHVTARCNNREIFPVPMPEAWEIFSDYLHLLHHSYQIGIFSYVLMPNHFHMICRDPELQLSKGMNVFMRETSKEMNRMSGRINRVWGGPFHNTIISDPRYFLNVYKYNYLNPVAAGICKRVEEYPWSTLQILLGMRKGIIPIQPDETLFSGVEETLNWLNEGYNESDSWAIQLALRKKIFQLPKNPRNKYLHDLDRKDPPLFTR